MTTPSTNISFSSLNTEFTDTASAQLLINNYRVKQLAGVGTTNQNIDMGTMRNRDQVSTLRQRPILNKIVSDGSNTLMAISQGNNTGIQGDHVWWSTDAGATWTQNTNWVSTSGFARIITLLSYTNGAWFLGGQLDSTGSALGPAFLIRSTDGVTWTDIRGNLPNAIGNRLPRDITYGLCSDSTSIYLLMKWQTTGSTSDLFWTTDFVTWTGVWGNQISVTNYAKKITYLSGRFYIINDISMAYTTNPKTGTTGFYVGGPAVGPWLGCSGLPGTNILDLSLKGSTYGALIYNNASYGSSTFYTSSDGITFSLAYSFPVPAASTPTIGYSLTNDGSNFYVGVQRSARQVGGIGLTNPLCGTSIYRSATGASWTALDQNDLSPYNGTQSSGPYLSYTTNAGLIAVDTVGTVKRSTNPTAGTPTWTYPTTPGSSYSSEMLITDMTDNRLSGESAIAMAVGTDLKTGQGGIWKCTDGLNWNRIYTASGNPSRIGSITYGDGGWVAIDSTGATTYQSTDNGSNWTARATNLPAKTDYGYRITSSTNATNSYVVYASFTALAYRSTDLATWSLVLTASNQIQGLKFCLDTGYLMVGGFSGVYTSNDGSTWSGLTSTGISSSKNAITDAPAATIQGVYIPRKVYIGNYFGDQCISSTVDLVNWSAGGGTTPANGLVHGDQNARLWTNGGSRVDSLYNDFRGLFNGDSTSLKLSLPLTNGMTFRYFKYCANVGQVTFLSDGASIVRIGYGV